MQAQLTAVQDEASVSCCASYPRAAVILRRVRQRDQAIGALLELDVIAHAMRGGIDVGIDVGVDPLTEGGGRADLRLTDGATSVTVEVASLNSLPVSAREASALCDRVYPTPWVMSWNLIAGGMFRGMSEPDEIPALERAAATFWQECRETPGPRVLDLPRLLIWAAPAGETAAITTIHQTYGDTFSGPPFDPRSYDRIFNRILS